MSVRYFIDVPKNLKRLPAIDSVARGLQWLTSLTRRTSVEFNYMWLGRTNSSSSIGSATGAELLLVNYWMTDARSSGPGDISRAMPFIEATHQLSALYGGPKPAWVEESLAMYLGLQALGHASPDDPASHSLLERFRAAASEFPMGLFAVQHEIGRGDVSHYAALFTKGIALWAAVDNEMQTVGDGSLSTHLEVIWTAKYDYEGRPPSDFGIALGLPAMSWKQLEKDYLGG